MVLLFLFPLWLIVGTTRLEPSRGKVSSAIAISANRRLPVPQMLSTFHRRAQRTAFRRRGVHQQSRSFARGNAQHVADLISSHS